MSYATIDDLRSHLGGPKQHSAAYAEKMLHALPKAETVDRAKFILGNCADKRVLEFGASGILHEQIRATAAALFGVDRHDGDGVMGVDLDDVSQDTLPVPPFLPDLIVCGELLEHLSNPGWFLARLKRQFWDVPVIVTVPNAFSAAAQRWLLKGQENVNRDHVCWYSPKTISVLLERAGYVTGGLFYYGGDGPTAEGLIVVTE